MNVRFEPTDEPGRPRTREEHLMNIAARALDVCYDLRRERINRVRKGTVGGRATVYWSDLIALLDAVDNAFPGAVERMLKSADDARKTRETERRNRKK